MFEYIDEYDTDSDELEIVLKRILKFDATNIDYILTLFKIQKNNNNYNAALNNILLAVKLDLNNLHIWELLNDLLLFNFDLIKPYSKKKTLEFLKTLNMTEITNPDIIMNMGKSYIFLNNFIEAKEIFAELILQFPQNPNYYVELASVYMRLNNIKLAIQNYEEAVKLPQVEPNCYAQLATCYILSNRYTDAIRMLKRALKVEDIDFLRSDYLASLMEVYIALGDKANFNKTFKEFANNTKFKLRTLFRLKNYINITDEEWIEVYKFLINHDIDNIYTRQDEIEVILNHIIKITIGLKDFGKIRYYLITLFYWVLSLKRSLRWSHSGESGIDICHYSSLNTLNHLIKTESQSEFSYFRLNSVAYVNDPTEGMVFLNLVKRVFPDSEKVLSNLFENNIDNKEVEISSRNTYLASFSLARNKLPLWVQYAQNGEGCCYVMDSSSFDWGQNDFNLNHYIEKYDTECLENSSKYCLYQVDYLNSDEIGKKNKSRKFLNEAASKIGEALSKLAPYLQNQQIRQITIDCLDQVRFLFKEDDYEHEKEVRVLKFVDKEDVLMAPTTEGYRVPHLYVNMEKQIHFKEVILGPRVEKVSEIAQYLHNGINVSKVSMSNIKYR